MNTLLFAGANRLFALFLVGLVFGLPFEVHAASCDYNLSVSIYNRGQSGWTAGNTWGKWCNLGVCGTRDDGPAHFDKCTEVWVTGTGSACVGGSTISVDSIDPGRTGAVIDLYTPETGVDLVRIQNCKKGGTVLVKYKLVASCGTFYQTATIAFDGLGFEDDNDSGPGSGCIQCKHGFGAGGTGTHSADFWLSLGKDANGHSAGTVGFEIPTATANLGVPSLLTMDYVGLGVEVIPPSGTIQQVKTPEGLVTVETDGSYKYRLKAYYDTDVGPKSGSTYTVTGSPFVTWIIENPDTSSAYNRLRITEQRSGLSDRVSLFTYTSTNHKWELLRPDSTTLTRYWERIDSTYTNEVEQVWFNSALVKQTTNKWEWVGSITNRLLRKTVEGDGTVNTNITAYTYNASNRVERIDYPDGNWVYYKYDEYGRVTNEFRPFGLNSPPTAGTTPSVTNDLCRLIEYRYSLNGTEDNTTDDGLKQFNLPRRVIEFVPVMSGTMQQKEISRLYRKADDSTIEETKATVAGQKFDECTPTQITTVYLNNNSYSHRKTKSISHENGTATLFTYSTNTTTTTTVETIGEPYPSWTSPTNIVKGTETTTVRDLLDRIISVTVKAFDGGTQFVIDGYNNYWSLSAVPAPLVTGTTTGTPLRNNYNGWVGFKFTVGSAPVIVTDLGRWIVSSNMGTHNLKIVKASDGSLVSGASASLNTAGATAGAYAYAPLTAPVTLQANTAYCIVSEETSGGDQWYEYNSSLTAQSGVTINSAAYSTNTTTLISYAGGTGNGYGPLDFIFRKSWNAAGRDYKTVGMDGMTNSVLYACCGLDQVIDKDGLITSYEYDVLGRKVAELRAEGTAIIKTTNVLDSLGRVLVSKRIGTNGSAIVQQRISYDILGRAVYETNALNGITTHLYSKVDDRIREITLFPDDGTRTNDFFRDGSLQKSTGTAVFPVQYEYGAEMESSVARTFRKEMKLDSTYTSTNEWIKTYGDMYGRPYRIVKGSITNGDTNNPVFLSYWNSYGNLERTVDADNVWMRYDYDTLGRQAHAVLDLNRTNIDLAGLDRVISNVPDVITAHSTTVKRSIHSAWTTPSTDASDKISMTETAVDGLRQWRTTYTNSSSGIVSSNQSTVTSLGYRYITNTDPDGASSVDELLYGRRLSTTRKNSGGTPVAKTSYVYDQHGRVLASIDARNGATTYAYNDMDQVTSVTTPNPGNGSQAQVTLSYYDSLGRMTNSVLPDSTQVTNRYSARGELTETRGSRAYPVAYTYDSQGRRKTMKTWRAYPSTGEATTTWNYDERGNLKEKVDNDGKKTEYEYTLGDRLRKRKWARSVSGTRLETTYGYGFHNGSAPWHADLTSIDYNDSTPDVTYDYDRMGRRSTASRDSMTTTYSYLWGNILRKEAYSGGALNGLSVTNDFDAAGRKNSAIVEGIGGTLNRWTYDTAGRLESAADGTNSATYSYLANSSLIGQILYKSNTFTAMTTIKQYDQLNRLQSIVSTPGDASQIPFAYFYNVNDANQRSRVTMADGSFWVYDYDKLGQVTSAKRYWSDGTPVAGQQHEYAFDEIGNRTSTKSGGDEDGLNLLQSPTYTLVNNGLNQYTNRTVSEFVDVMGLAASSASVTVNSGATYRKGEYFRKVLSVANSSANVYQSVSVSSTIGATNETATGNLLIPKANQGFVHDLDGNLTTDSVWDYVWDAENRLIEMRPITNNPATSKLWLKFTYDTMGRRVQKTVATWQTNSSSWSITTSNCFAYDNWNLLGGFQSSDKSLISGYLWGADLSGIFQGAGGVGGLICVREIDTAKRANFAAMDGNGNLVGLFNAANGFKTAHYEYDAFGQTIRSSGTMAASNPFRFSTKFADAEVGLLYYGHRYYSPSSGRWLSRDPIEEKGGLNLYSACNNNTINEVDFLGNQSASPGGSIGIANPEYWEILEWVAAEEGKVCITQAAKKAGTAIAVGVATAVCTKGCKPGKDPCKEFNDLRKYVRENPELNKILNQISQVIKNGGTQSDLNNVPGLTPEVRSLIADMYKAAADCYRGKKDVSFNDDRADFVRGDRPTGPGSNKPQ